MNRSVAVEVEDKLVAAKAAVRLCVTVGGTGWIAQSHAPKVLAVGCTPQEAAENARVMAQALLGAEGDVTLIVRVSAPGSQFVIEQPLGERIGGRRRSFGS